MFGTSGIRGRFGEAVTTELALSIGHALGACGYETIALGRDGRDTGQLLADALASGAREAGIDVIRLGQVATPTLARSVGWHDADAGVIVTASHNPPADNGFKFWTPSGQAFDEGQRQLLEDAIRDAAGLPVAWDELGDAVCIDEAADRHRDVLVDGGESLAGLSVVVDVGNGMGGTTVEVLRSLGADVQTLNADVDGGFPARPSEPTATTCTTLCSVVAATDADMGIAHDGDADRMMAVDETGRFLGGDELLALFGSAMVGEGDRVAVPVNTSLLVADAVAERGGEIVRTRVGDVYVAEAARADDVVFGGEPSGAWIWPGETLCPDGPLAARRLAELVVESGPLSELVTAYDSYPIQRAVVETDAKKRVMDAVEGTVQSSYEEVTTLDGVRVAHSDGWFLIRASGTEPLVRVTAEARSAGRAAELLGNARELVADAMDGV
ncbi:phosphoglucosamine mutase [Halorarum halophilum]|uniref:Phosphoglucosamine mutase n=1 Tax=Halorarum halophilum TaxID=2743090 RepID=A0A7D5KF59_9EURY|nr:phosphoglucosamine mutase [Halobaculum halophilum]QLG27376.1 phosphoglucosamine mutase [Halobaculum halophilum]